MGKHGPLPGRDKIRHLKSVARVSKGSSQGSSVQGSVVRVAPKAPSWLDREGKAEWRRVVPELDRLGLLSKLDRAVLGAYCDVWSKFVELRRVLKEDGLIGVGHRGRPVKHPAWQMYRDSLSMCLKLWTQLALTPNARLRMEIPDLSDEGSGADLLD